VDNLLAFSRLKAQAKYIVKQSKRSSWKDYVSTINSKTAPSTVWKKIKSISGRSTSAIPAIDVNGKVVTSLARVVDSFGKHFASVFSNDQYGENFLRDKVRSDRQELLFNSDNTELDNKPLNNMGTPLSCQNP
jgi:hypothetical protein